MKKVNINSDYITLGQFLKYASIISNGSEAKIFLLNTKVFINNEIDTRRGRKLYPNDVIEINNNKFLIVKE